VTSWTIAGKIIDIYDDPHLSILHEDQDVLRKVASETIVDMNRIHDLADSQFALMLEDQDGKMHRKYPMTQDTIRLSAVYLEKTGSHLLPIMRHVAAYHLNKVASALDIEVGPKTASWAKRATLMPSLLASNFVKWADSKRSYMEDVALPEARLSIQKSVKTAAKIRDLPEKTGSGAKIGLYARLPAIQDETLRSELRKLAANLDKEKPENVVELFRAIDKKFGLSHAHNRVMSPEDAVECKLSSEIGSEKLAKIVKLASDPKKLMELGLNPGTIQELRSAPGDVYPYLPDEIRERIETEILPTL